MEYNKCRILGAFDYETTEIGYGDELEFRLVSLVYQVWRRRKDGWVLTEEVNEVFESNESFFAYLQDMIQKTRKVILYAFNLKFDFRMLVEFFRQYTYKPIFTGGKLLSANFTKAYIDKKNRPRNRTVLELRDLCGLLPYMNLRSVGEMIGHEKLEFDDYNQAEITQDYIDYCIQDSVVVLKALYWLVNGLNEKMGLHFTVWTIPLTISSVSRKYFESKTRRFEKEIIQKGGRRRKINTLFLDYQHDQEYRREYFGGRVEVFNYNPTETCGYFDFNSLYPTVMCQNLYPCPPYYPVDAIHAHRPETCLIDCTFTDFEDFPLIPSRIDGKVLFVSGEKRRRLYKHEFELLEQSSRIIEIHSCVLCTQWDTIFDYIGDLYAWRMECRAEGHGFGQVIKLIMNATYGKLGQRWDREELVCISVEDVKQYHLSGKQIKYNPDTDAWYIQNEIVANNVRGNVLIASYITSYARLKLWTALTTVNNAGGNVYYCDTDSVVCEVQYGELLNLGNDLGQMKNEWAQVTPFHALSPKTYIMGDTMKAKGIPRALLPTLTVSQMLEGVHVKRLCSLKLACKNGLNAKRYDEFDRVWMDFSTKRRIHIDLTTSPWTPADIQDENHLKTSQTLHSALLCA